MRLTRDGFIWALLAVAGGASFLLDHFGVLQQAFPGITPAWHARIELASMVAGWLGAYLRLSPLPLSWDHPLATQESGATLSPFNSTKPLAIVLLAAAVTLGATSACAVHQQPPAGTYSPAGQRAFDADQFLKDLTALSATAINLNAQTGRMHLSDQDTALVRAFTLAAGAALQDYGTGASPLQTVRDAYFALLRQISVDGSQHPQLAGALLAIGVALNQVHQ